MKRTTIINRAALLTISLLILLGFYNKTLGQSSILSATKLEGKITIDGQVNDDGWASIPIIPTTQKVPNAGDEPTQKTEIRIAYDADYIYFSGRMYDDEPDKIIANSKKRDDFTENTEWAGLLIDSYNDRENALAFYVTPTGSRFDMALSNDTQGPTAYNLSWNSYWDAAVSRTEEGWFAEIRIPFTSLPFELIDGQAIMGITTWRYLARNDETDIYPPRGLSSGSSFRPSLTQRFSFKGINQKKPIHITPYLLGGMATNNSYSIESDGIKTQQLFKKEIGIDAKIALNSNATLDVTINTDFAQVEADDQQINLTRLNIFFPEKRLFFQERSSLFDFNFGNYDKIFHSRRIGIVDGEQARIYGGLRAVGKFGDWETGIINMQTAAHAHLASENFTVFRLKKKILNENSNIGLIYTNRTDFNDSFNAVYGLDATLKIIKQNFLSLRWAQSFSDGLENRANSLNPSKFYLELAKRSTDGFTYNINFGRTGKDYLPAIGFEHRYDFSKINLTTAYNIFPSKESKIVQHGPYLNSDRTWGNTTGNVESEYLNIGYNVNTKTGFTYDLKIQAEAENIGYSLNFPSDLVIAPGQYRFHSITGLVSSPSSKRLAYSIWASSGSFYGGQKSTIVLSPSFNVTEDLILIGNYEINRLNFPNEHKQFNIQLSKIKAFYTFNTKLSVSIFVQHNNITKTFIGSTKIRYNPKEGNDFYFVFNGDMNQDRNRFEHLIPVSNSSTLYLKYSHTFHL